MTSRLDFPFGIFRSFIIFENVQKNYESASRNEFTRVLRTHPSSSEALLALAVVRAGVLPAPYIPRLSSSLASAISVP
jgi:hypothetical protein